MRYTKTMSEDLADVREGFSKKEIKMANDANFLSVSLSKNRLRTDTAASVACYTLISENEQSILYYSTIAI